jgi:hypothetical protein
MTGLIPSFPRNARNASVSWPPEQSASNALDARRVAEGVGQKFLDAGDQADAFLRHDTTVLPGVRINTHGRRNASTMAWILLLRPPFVLRQARNESPIAEIRPPFSAAGAAASLDGYPARLVSAAKAPQPPRIFTAGFPACSSGQSDCRSSCAGRTPSGSPPRAAGLARQLRFLIFPSGGNEAGSLRSPSAHA